MSELPRPGHIQQTLVPTADKMLAVPMHESGPAMIGLHLYTGQDTMNIHILVNFDDMVQKLIHQPMHYCN